MLNSSEPIDFIAKIRLLRSDEGGRSGFASDIWRPLFKLPERVSMTSTNLRFIDKEQEMPGEEVNIEAQILSKETFASTLYCGLKFELREGPKLVAIGEIVSVPNQNLLSNHLEH